MEKYDFALHSSPKKNFLEVLKLPTVYLTSTGTSTLLAKQAIASANFIISQGLKKSRDASGAIATSDASLQ
jgi:hypothetical protein